MVLHGKIALEARLLSVSEHKNANYKNVDIFIACIIRSYRKSGRRMMRSVRVYQKARLRINKERRLYKMRKNYKGFILGVLCTIVAMALIVPAAAESSIRNITVQAGGIDIYIDGNLRIPTDANGNVVEPFLHGGTTYLPVRALTGMLTDKAVHWDAETSSIYIGTRPVAESTPMDQLRRYAGGRVQDDSGFLTGQRAQFRMLDNTISPFNRLERRVVDYIINSEYSYINGEFAIEYFNLGDRYERTLNIYNVDQFDAQTLLDTYTARAAEGVVQVRTNIVGVDILRLEIDNMSAAMFYNVTLTGVN